MLNDTGRVCNCHASVLRGPFVSHSLTSQPTSSAIQTHPGDEPHCARCTIHTNTQAQAREESYRWEKSTINIYKKGRACRHIFDDTLCAARALRQRQGAPRSTSACCSHAEKHVIPSGMSRFHCMVDQPKLI